MTSLTATSDLTELALATRGLREAYGDHLAVAGLDLSVPPGLVCGFLGPNGAGKTTTMRMLTGLIHPDAGEIHVLGTPPIRAAPLLPRSWPRCSCASRVPTIRSSRSCSVYHVERAEVAQ